MATSLVSTGVQFPDSTIQTTAASAASGWVLLTSGTFPGNTTDIDITSPWSTTYDNYWMIFENVACTNFNFRLDWGSGFQTSSYYYIYQYGLETGGGSDYYAGGYSASRIPVGQQGMYIRALNAYIYNRNGTMNKGIVWNGVTGYSNYGYQNLWGMGGQYNNTGAITGVRITGDGNFTSGSYWVFGLKKT